MLEAIWRIELPISLRLALLSLIAMVVLLYTVVPQWFESIRILAYLPLQRFSWQSEKYTANAWYRGSAIASVSVMYSIFIFGHFHLTERNLFGFNDTSFLLLLLAVLCLVALKSIFNLAYFNLHQSEELGQWIIDYQHSINLIATLIVGSIMVVDVFYFHMGSSLYTVAIVLLLIQFLVKLFGIILMLQNNFSFPIITLFVYLCTFEIVPMLIVAKVLFVNS